MDCGPFREAVSMDSSPAMLADTPTKKGRRSWFGSAPGKPMKFEIAVEKEIMAVPQLSPDVDILELTHFTRAPKIDFGSLIVGKSATRQLVIRNPHEYEQQVVLEKFPYQKDFNVDQAEFVVDATTDFLLTLLWQPTEEMRCREMVILKVDSSFRLQVILFGQAQLPKLKKVKRSVPSSLKKPSIPVRGMVSKGLPTAPPKRRVLGENQELNLQCQVKDSKTAKPKSRSDPSRLRAAARKQRKQWKREEPAEFVFTTVVHETKEVIEIVSTETVQEEAVVPATCTTGTIVDQCLPELTTVTMTRCSSSTDGQPGNYLPVASKSCPDLVKDDPSFPDTPTRRMTYIKKDDATTPTCISSDKCRSSQPFARQLAQKVIDSGIVKDDPNIPDTPTRRATFVKDDQSDLDGDNLLLEDSSLLSTPVRRETFVKKSAAQRNVVCRGLEELEEKLARLSDIGCGDSTPVVEYTSTSLSSRPSPSRKMYHPHMLTTSPRIDEAVEEEVRPDCQMASSIEESFIEKGQTYRVTSSFRKAKLSDIGLTPVSTRDFKVAKMSDVGLEKIDHLFVDESNDKSDTESDWSPTSSQYETPLITPQDSPAASDREDDIFEESIMFPSGVSMTMSSFCGTPSQHHTILDGDGSIASTPKFDCNLFSNHQITRIDETTEEFEKIVATEIIKETIEVQTIQILDMDGNVISKSTDVVDSEVQQINTLSTQEMIQRTAHNIKINQKSSIALQQELPVLPDFSMLSQEDDPQKDTYRLSTPSVPNLPIVSVSNDSPGDSMTGETRAINLPILSPGGVELALSALNAVEFDPFEIQDVPQLKETCTGQFLEEDQTSQSNEYIGTPRGLKRFSTYTKLEQEAMKVSPQDKSPEGYYDSLNTTSSHGSLDIDDLIVGNSGSKELDIETAGVAYENEQVSSNNLETPPVREKNNMNLFEVTEQGNHCFQHQQLIPKQDLSNLPIVAKGKAFNRIEGSCKTEREILVGTESNVDVHFTKKENKSIAGSAPTIDVETSPKALLEESFSHEQVIDCLQTVRVELQHRMSSTPVSLSHRLAQQKETELSPLYKTPSPIGKHVNQDTIVKVRPSLPQVMQKANLDSIVSPHMDTTRSSTVSKKQLFSGLQASGPEFGSATNLDRMLDAICVPEWDPNHTTPPMSPRSTCGVENVCPTTFMVIGSDNVKESQLSKPKNIGASRKKIQVPCKTAIPPPSIKPTITRTKVDGLKLGRQKQNTNVKKPALDRIAPTKRPHSSERNTQGKTPCQGNKKICSKPPCEKGRSKSPVPISRDLTITRTQQLRIQASQAKEKTPAPKSVKQRTAPRRSQASKPVAKSNLVLIKNPTKTALPQHPLPFASKNMYYDERWMQKQERGFEHWLNFVLTPQDILMVEAKSTMKVDARKLTVDLQKFVPLAPTKEILSIRAYSARRKLNNLRRKACLLFQSESVVKVIKNVECAINARSLAVRVDRKLHADVGIKQAILDLVLCYNPLWLRMALETIYGQLIPMTDNSDVISLSRFILMRFLGNPDIAAEYSHPSVPHLYKDGYSEAVAQFTLKKFLVLVTFLDQAKLSKIIHYDPCLFCKTAKYKTSRDLLLTFSRDYLSGEGDLCKHLGYLGYTVSVTQTKLEEFDYAVTNLAVDLRDGLRLTRVVELLTLEWSLTRQLRSPAISRLQKVHNVGVAMAALAARGCDSHMADGGAIEARDVVDGHREKTLRLLWHIIFTFHVEMQINEVRLREEVIFLRRHLVVSKELAALVSGDLDVAPSIDRRQSMEPELYSSRPILGLLLRWCQAVCAHYGLKVENFTVSFSDGRALCYLVHHYHPALLAHSDVRMDTTQSYLQKQDDGDSDDSFSHDWTQTFQDGSDKSSIFEALLANEKENFKVLYEKVTELGGVPIMLHSRDMSNTIPDEKVVITFVTYLCMRLLDVAEEVRAARIIQAAWRRARLHRKRAQRQASVMSAVLRLQSWWRRCCAIRKLKTLRQEKKMAQRQAQQYHAAAVIQAAIRSFLARHRLNRQKKAAACLQACWRGKVDRQHMASMHKNAAIIQSHYRAYRTCVDQRHSYLKAKSAAIVIQKCIRHFLTRRKIKDMHQKATCIASWYRMHVQRRKFMYLKNAVLVIKARWKIHKQNMIQKCNSKKQEEAAVVIQRTFRKVRTQREKHEWAATKLQASYRGLCMRRAYLKLRHATCVLQARHRAKLQGRLQHFMYHAQRGATIILQAWVRGVLCRSQLQLKTQAVVSVQKVWRGYYARKQLNHANMGATVIQHAIRRWLQMKHIRRQFLAKRRAAVIVQAAIKGYLQRCAYIRYLQSCTTIQAHVRGYLQRRQNLHQWQAAISIQAAWRGHCTRVQYRKTCKAVVTLQQHWRALVTGWRARIMICQQHEAAARIQALVRGIIARKHFRMMKSVLRIQAVYRGYCVRKDIINQHRATCIIQSHYRGYQLRCQVKAKETAARTIQSHVRAWIAGAHQRRHYLLQKKASVTIQAVCRGLAVRREYLQQKRAAVIIQSKCRQWLVQSRYLKQKAAAGLIQCRYRQHVLENKAKAVARARYVAAVTMQAAVRGHLVRKEQRLQKHSVIVLQTWFRRCKAQTAYQASKQAAQVIQIWYRAQREGKCVRRQYLINRGAVITLQAAVRGWITRQELKRRQTAAVRIQALYRMWKLKTEYKKLQKAVHIIQVRYHATHLMHQMRMEYTSKKDATVKIQAVYRGYRVRKDIRNRNKAACMIQSHFRGHQLRCHLKAIETAARTIQIHVRAWIAGTQQRRHYLQQKNASVTIQAVCRGLAVRREYLQQKRAAVIIQSKCRQWLVQSRYLKQKAAAGLIQCSYRQHVLEKKAKEVARARYVASVTMQAAVRGHLVRKEQRLQKHSVIVLQAWFRRCKAQTAYKASKQAAQVIQIWYRAQREGKCVRRQHLINRGAVVTLQAAVRGWITRQELKRRQTAAVRIQALYRMWKLKTEYKKLQKAVHIIQVRYRATYLMHQMRMKYTSKKDATVKIQAVYRGYCVRKNIRNQNKAACMIQSHFRGHQLRRQLKTEEMVARTIQIHVRAWIVGTQQRRHYLQQKKASVTIQAVCRGLAVRREYLQQKRAAVIIQSKCRQWLVQSRYLKQKAAAGLIQCSYRQHVLEKKVKEVARARYVAAVTMQSAVRGHLVRKEQSLQKHSVIVLQTWFRRCKAQTAYKASKQAAQVIQIWYRAQREGKCVRRQHLINRGAVVTLQAAVRGWITRQELKRRQTAAVRIQALYRMWKLKTEYKKLQKAVHIIQVRYRATQLKSEAQQEFKKQREAALTLQSAWRGRRIRHVLLRWHCAALILQACFRRNRQQAYFVKLKQAAITIQSHFKAMKSMQVHRQTYLMQRGAVITIQSVVRGYALRKSLAKNCSAARVIQKWWRGIQQRNSALKYLKLQQAAKAIQTRWRATQTMHIARLEFCAMKQAAIVLQAAIRGWLMKRQMLQQHQAATVLQAQFRCVRQRSRYIDLLSAVCSIQRRFRAIQHSKVVRKQFVLPKASTTVIQRRVRSWIQWHIALKQQKAAIAIQSWYRCCKLRFRYLILKETAIKLQTYYRASMVVKNARCQYLKLKSATVRIQAWSRGLAQRRMLNKQKSAAVTIQTYWHMFVQKRKYCELQKAATVIQIHYRALVQGRTVRRVIEEEREAAHIEQQLQHQRRVAYISHCEKRHLAAALIQRKWRCHLMIRHASKHLTSVITIQQWMRAYLQRHRFLQVRKAVCVLQKAARSYLAKRHAAAACIQAAVRKCLMKQIVIRHKKAALVIQSLWRGHCVRRSSTSKKVKIARQRIKKATLEATDSRTLGSRTVSALDYLLNFSQVGPLLQAVIDLEVATRLSAHCCEMIVNENAPEVLYKLVCTLNRSVPHLEIMQHSFLILLNLAKYEPTFAAVSKPPMALETLVEYMAIHREKANIFFPICHLLGLLADSTSIKQDILSNTVFVQKLRSVYSLTKRRQQLLQKQAVTKNKIAASVRYPTAFSITQRNKNIKCNFQHIIEPLQAIQFALVPLGILD